MVLLEMAQERPFGSPGQYLGSCRISVRPEKRAKMFHYLYDSWLIDTAKWNLETERTYISSIDKLGEGHYVMRIFHLAPDGIHHVYHNRVVIRLSSVNATPYIFHST